MQRNVPLNEISELIFKGNPYIKFEKILPEDTHSTIINNVIGHTNIEHQGVSLIEKYAEKNNSDIYLSLDIKIKENLRLLSNDTKNLNQNTL